MYITATSLKASLGSVVHPPHYIVNRNIASGDCFSVPSAELD